MLVSLGNCVTLQAPIGSDFHGGDWMPACVSLFPVGLLSGHGRLHISPAQTQDAGTASKYQKRFVERVGRGMQGGILKFPVYAPEGGLYAFEGLPCLYRRAT